MTQVLPTGENIQSPEHAVIAGLDRTFTDLGGREGDSLVGLVGPEIAKLSGAIIRAYRCGSAAVQWAVNIPHGDTDVILGYADDAAHILKDNEIPPGSVALPSDLSDGVAYMCLNTDWTLLHPAIPGQRLGS
jgi:hypothetical protein